MGMRPSIFYSYPTVWPTGQAKASATVQGAEAYRNRMACLPHQRVRDKHHAYAGE